MPGLRFLMKPQLCSKTTMFHPSRCLFVIAIGVIPCFAKDPAAQAARQVRLSSLDLKWMGQEFGRPGVDRVLENGSPGRPPLSIAGQRFEHGIATHAESYLTIALDGKATAFQAVCGVDDDSAASPASVRFHIWGDGRELWKSGVLKAGDKGLPVKLPLQGIKRLSLWVDHGGDGNRSDHADWAAATIDYAGVAPVAVANTPLETPEKVMASFGLEVYYEEDADKSFAEAEVKRMKELLKEIAPHLALNAEILKATAIIRSRFDSDGSRHDVPNHKARNPANQTMLITDEELGANGWGGPGACVVNKGKLQWKLDRGANSADISLHEWMHAIAGQRVNGRALDWLHDNPKWGFNDADYNDKSGDGVWREWYRFYLRWK